MNAINDHFPVFEANQVLSSGHLNDLVAYLEEQERLTRANLIGIGIACGVAIELKLEAGKATIRMCRGCGVSSEGYLLVEPDDVHLVSYRDYVVPTDPGYAPFVGADGKPYQLWELFPKGEPGTTPLGERAGFLDDKAVVLFLELEKQNLRNCSPNNCDDKGALLTSTVRRLLVLRSDLDAIIAAARGLKSGLTSSDLESAVLQQLDLPDIRLPRFDVPRSGLTTSNDVFAAYIATFRSTRLVRATASALSAAYDAFKPFLAETYPEDPFGLFSARFDFLEQAPTTSQQVRFLQYYYDLFDDVLRAYDEFRSKSLELVCACCPPKDLFPRHLMLGLLRPEAVAHAAIYRQQFLRSPAINECSDRASELLHVFKRLVEMTRRFTDEPALPPPGNKTLVDPQIRLTPSALRNDALGDKAIPYYYKQDGRPPLYELWSYDKSRRHRAHHNLSYRFDEFSPAVPQFVSSPLDYDLEPHDFLRIEGHLGKNYERVLSTLLSQRDRYRLPIDVVAIRTGAYDETQPVDLEDKSVCFQDLEALYDALREELLASLAEGMRDFYDVPAAENDLPGGSPRHPLLKAYAPNYKYPGSSVGAWFEKYLDRFQSMPYVDVDQDRMDPNAVLRVYCTLFTGTDGLHAEHWPHAVSIYYFSKLAEILPDRLDALRYAEFQNKYQDLVALVRFFRSKAAEAVAADLKAFVPQEDLIDDFDRVLFTCKLDPIKSVHAEFVRRLTELRKKQFLSNFQKEHPGIQHKAGVPLGGTFIVVYHQDPSRDPGRRDRADALLERLRDAGLVTSLAATRSVPGMTTAAGAGERAAAVDITAAIERIQSNRTLALNADVKSLLDTLVGTIPIFKPGAADKASKIIATTVDGLPDGAVIADFYVPYLVSCSCVNVHYVLPGLPPPSFRVEIACTGRENTAEVKVAAQGGTAPYSIKVDDHDYVPLGDTLTLSAGDHTLKIRDSELRDAAVQTITVPSPLKIGEATYVCSEDNKTYTAAVDISGGTPPYSANGEAFAGTRYTTPPVASGTASSIEVVDDRGCTVKTAISHTCVPPCDLPCDGIALTRGYRFWLPEPADGRQYKSAAFEKVVFQFEFPAGTTVDMAAEVQALLKIPPVATLNRQFSKAVQTWLQQINKAILAKTGEPGALIFKYDEGLQGSLGTLWIEYFECLKFDIQIAAIFDRGRDREGLQIAYSTKGTVIRILRDDKEVSVPPFDGIRTDKCAPDSPSRPICKEPPFDLTVTQRLDGQKLSLSVSANGGTPRAFLWEVPDATPSMANGASAQFTLPPARTGTSLFRVTAFDGNGCSVTKDEAVIRG